MTRPRTVLAPPPYQDEYYVPLRFITDKFDWLVTVSWNRLHYVPFTHDDAWFDEITDGGAEGTAACGLLATWWIPGIGSRLGLPRCAFCCRALGIPRGDGCPANDKTLRRDPA